MKVHILLATLCVVAGCFLGLSHHEWLAIVLCVGLVFCAEMFNTVVEDLAVAVSPEHSPRVERIKDMAAGAVLAASLAAGIVALGIFPEKMMRYMMTLPLPEPVSHALGKMVFLLWGG